LNGLGSARVRTATSVEAVVAEFLARYAGPGEAVAALEEFLALARRVDAGSGDEGRSWRRDDVYGRPTRRNEDST